MIVIGIPTNISRESLNHVSVREILNLPSNYVKAVAQAGAIPLLLPPVGKNLLDNYLIICNGILFSGGADVSPYLYNQEPAIGCGYTDPIMDEFMIELCRNAINQRIPVFGICRGLQLINVCMGGNLHQDLSRAGYNCIMHQQKALANVVTHSIEIKEDTFLYEWLQKTTIQINTRHHQAIDKLAPGLVSVAYARDGIIEAVQGVDAPVYAVQWHPEDLLDTDDSKIIFNNFVSLVEKTVKSNKSLRLI